MLSSFRKRAAPPTSQDPGTDRISLLSSSPVVSSSICLSPREGPRFIHESSMRMTRKRCRDGARIKRGRRQDPTLSALLRLAISLALLIAHKSIPPKKSALPSRGGITGDTPLAHRIKRHVRPVFLCPVQPPLRWWSEDGRSDA